MPCLHFTFRLWLYFGAAGVDGVQAAGQGPGGLCRGKEEGPSFGMTWLGKRRPSQAHVYPE